MYIGSAETYDFCMLVCFALMFAQVYFHLISNVKIFRTFENRVPIQTFEEWHSVNYCYVSYEKSETSDIWRTGAWFLKPFREKVDENYIYDLIKPNSTVKTRIVYRGCNVCYQDFLENGKIEFKSKI